jgi:hypothetical protein
MLWSSGSLACPAVSPSTLAGGGRSRGRTDGPSGPLLTPSPHAPPKRGGVPPSEVQPRSDDPFTCGRHRLLLAEKTRAAPLGLRTCPLVLDAASPTEAGSASRRPKPACRATRRPRHPGVVPATPPERGASRAPSGLGAELAAAGAPRRPRRGRYPRTSVPHESQAAGARAADHPPPPVARSRRVIAGRTSARSPAPRTRPWPAPPLHRPHRVASTPGGPPVARPPPSAPACHGRSPVPSSWFLTTSTVFSARRLAGLLHPAADPGVHPVSPRVPSSSFASTSGLAGSP